MASQQSEAPADARMKKRPAAKPSAPRVPERRPAERPADRSEKPRVPTPQPATKSPEELKAILRKMTSQTAGEKQKVQTEKKESLKGTLADVLKQSGSSQAQQTHTPSVSKPAEPAQAPKPYEVPEDMLRKVLNGDA